MRIPGVRNGRWVASLVATLALCAGSATAQAALVPVGVDFSTTLPSGVTASGNDVTVTNVNNNNVATSALSSTLTDDFYVSFTLDASAIGTIGNNEFMTIWFNDDSTYDTSNDIPAIGLKGNQGTGSGPNDLVVRLSGVGGTFAEFDLDSATNQTVTILGKLSKTSGSTYNQFDLWAFADPSSTVLEDLISQIEATTPHAVSTTGGLLSEVSYIGIRTANLNGTVSANNIQISAVPEPATLALWGLGGLAGLAIGYRKRKLAANA